MFMFVTILFELINKARPRPVKERELTLTDLITIEQQLQNGKITQESINFLRKFVHPDSDSPTITVYDDVDFNVRNINNNTIAIITDNRNNYGTVYKTGGNIFYKNSSGRNPSTELEQKLQQGGISQSQLLVNIVDGNGPDQDDPNQNYSVWMTLRNSFLISQIVLKDKCNFQQATDFCNKNMAIKYEAQVCVQTCYFMSEIMQNLDQKNINIEEIINNRAIEGVDDIDCAVMILLRRLTWLISICPEDNPIEIWEEEEYKNWITAAALCVKTLHRVNKLEFRHVQLMTIILFFVDRKNTFFEVKTGEGKTYVIAIIAAIKVLLGSKVDIITCNNWLASANQNEMRKFYETLGITSRSNFTDSANLESPYSAQIVYGSMHQWQFDALNNCLKLKDTCMHERSHDFSILDEFDLIAIDNSKYLAKIGEPFPGMETLSDVYRRIYNHLWNSASDMTKYVPLFLRPYCIYMEDTWQKSREKLNDRYIKDKHYTIEDTRIIPVDVDNTGMLMKNSVFADGFQQFVEIHCCIEGISHEILNSICVSNYGFLHLYKKLCGFTGTLGTHEEEQILREIFNQSLNCYKIPMHHQPSRFLQEETIIGYDGEFEIMRRAIREQNVTIMADNKYNRLNNLSMLASTLPQSSRERIRIQHLIENDDKSVRAAQQIVVADNYETSSNLSPVNFIESNDAFLIEIESYCACVYTKWSLTWKLNAINEILAKRVFPSENNYFKQVETKINGLLRDNPDVRFIIYNWTYVNLRTDNGSNNFLLCDNLEELIRNSPETNYLFVYVFSRNFVEDRQELDCPRLKLSDEFDMLRDIVLFKPINSEMEKKIFVFGKVKKHYQLIMEKIKEKFPKRSVLVICANLYQLDQLYFHLKCYIDEEQISKLTGTETPDAICNLPTIDVRQVCLTTNIGGRGADYKTTPELDQAGGLHVIVTFLPHNERIQQQAFGRTARNGRPGSGQLIIDAMNIIDYLPTSFASDSDQFETLLQTIGDSVIDVRNRNYISKLKHMKDVDLVQLRFHNELGRSFIEFYNNIKSSQQDMELDYILRDLVEYWAMWLKQKKYEHGTDTTMCAKEKFEIFKKDASGIIKGNTFYNPYHCAQRANYQFEIGNFEKAKELMQQTLDQEVFWESMLLEYVEFAKMAMVKEMLLEEAKEALQKVQRTDLLHDISVVYIAHIDRMLQNHGEPQQVQILHNNMILRNTMTRYFGREFPNFQNKIPGSWSTSGYFLALGIFSWITLHDRRSAIKYVVQAVGSFRKEDIRPELKEACAFIKKIGENYIISLLENRIPGLVEFYEHYANDIYEEIHRYANSQVATEDNSRSVVIGAFEFIEMTGMQETIKSEIQKIINETIITTQPITQHRLLEFIEEEEHLLRTPITANQLLMDEFRELSVPSFLGSRLKEGERREYGKVLSRKLGAFLSIIKQICQAINRKIEELNEIPSDPINPKSLLTLVLSKVCVSRFTSGNTRLQLQRSYKCHQHTYHRELSVAGPSC